jgi:protein gp37
MMPHTKLTNRFVLGCMRTHVLCSNCYCVGLLCALLAVLTTDSYSANTQGEQQYATGEKLSALIKALAAQSCVDTCDL